MQPRVTAIIVARDGADALAQTLQALREQSRQPETVLLVDAASREKDGVAALLADFAGERAAALPEGAPPADRIVRLERPASFGQAVQAALRQVPPPVEGEWLWLLAQDTAPEPGALEALLRTVQVAQSVAVAGPKLLNWDRPDHIREFGQTMTRFGARRQLEAEEYDQAQLDGQVDTLAVGPAGMLVDRGLWATLEGFDPALPVYDDGLDFGVRARLAGYRVALSAAARVRYRRDGVAGPRDTRRPSARRRGERQSRAAELHRRLAYAPAGVVWLHWLSLVPLAVLRSLLRLLQKEPGLIPGELAAAFQVAFTPGRTAEARRRIAAHRRTGWDVIRPLRIGLGDDRRRRAMQREIIHERLGTRRVEANFLTTGGLTVLLTGMVVGGLLCWRYLGGGPLSGGALLPLSDSIGALWQNASYGTRDTLSSVVAPADPFALVLALLGSLAPWLPSLVVVAILAAAPALAGLGAWYFACELSERTAPKVFTGLAWAIAPVLVLDVSGGRLPALLVHLILPWLAIAALRVRRSWPAAGTAGLLLAFVLACAPSLLPVAAAAWGAGIVLSLVWGGRALLRVIWIAVPAAALLLPLALYRLSTAGPAGLVELLADPGVAVPGGAGSSLQLLLGSPGTGWAGWSGVMVQLGGVMPWLGTAGSVPAIVVVAVLVAPLAVLAVLAVALPGGSRATVALIVALLGLSGAVLDAHLAVASSGGEPVWLWPGAALSVYWGGLVVAASCAVSALARAARPVATVVLLLLTILIVPAASALVIGQVPVQAGVQQVPAVVRAAALSSPQVGTLVIQRRDDGSLSAGVVRGTGLTLDQQSTVLSTGVEPTAAELALADAVGTLSSAQSGPVGDRLAQLGVAFILLQGQDDAFRAALDARPELQAAGSTNGDLLWRVSAAALDSTPQQPAAVQPSTASWIWALTAVSLLIGLWVALPTTPVRDRPPRGLGSRRGRTRPPAGPRVGAKTRARAEVSAADATADPEPGEQEPAEQEPGQREPGEAVPAGVTAPGQAASEAERADAAEGDGDGRAGS